MSAPLKVGHYTYQCEHGVVVRQCRCPGPHEVKVVECPDRCPVNGKTDTYRDRLATAVDVAITALWTEASGLGFEELEERQEIYKDMYTLTKIKERYESDGKS